MQSAIAIYISLNSLSVRKFQLFHLLLSLSFKSAIGFGALALTLSFKSAIGFGALLETTLWGGFLRPSLGAGALYGHLAVFLGDRAVASLKAPPICRTVYLPNSLD